MPNRNNENAQDDIMINRMLERLVQARGRKKRAELVANRVYANITPYKNQYLPKHPNWRKWTPNNLEPRSGEPLPVQKMKKAVKMAKGEEGPEQMVEMNAKRGVAVKNSKILRKKKQEMGEDEAMNEIERNVVIRAKKAEKNADAARKKAVATRKIAKMARINANVAMEKARKIGSTQANAVAAMANAAMGGAASNALNTARRNANVTMENANAAMNNAVAARKKANAVRKKANEMNSRARLARARANVMGYGVVEEEKEERKQLLIDMEREGVTKVNRYDGAPLQRGGASDYQNNIMVNWENLLAKKAKQMRETNVSNSNWGSGWGSSSNYSLEFPEIPKSQNSRKFANSTKMAKRVVHTGPKGGRYVKVWRMNKRTGKRELKRKYV